jgi:hypothetical protein
MQQEEIYTRIEEKEQNQLMEAQRHLRLDTGGKRDHNFRIFNTCMMAAWSPRACSLPGLAQVPGQWVPSAIQVAFCTFTAS